MVVYHEVILYLMCANINYSSPLSCNAEQMPGSCDSFTSPQTAKVSDLLTYFAACVMFSSIFQSSQKSCGISCLTWIKWSQCKQIKRGHVQIVPFDQSSTSEVVILSSRTPWGFPVQNKQPPPAAYQLAPVHVYGLLNRPWQQRKPKMRAGVLGLDTQLFKF